VKNNVTKQANGYSYDSPKAPVPMRKTKAIKVKRDGVKPISFYDVLK
jgi:hypothetical protein